LSHPSPGVVDAPVVVDRAGDSLRLDLGKPRAGLNEAGVVLAAHPLPPLPGWPAPRQWVREHGSARSARRARINALLVARECQLRGDRRATRWWLGSASNARAAEVLRKASRNADAALASLDRVLEAV